MTEEAGRRPAGKNSGSRHPQAMSTRCPHVCTTGPVGGRFSISRHLRAPPSCLPQPRIGVRDRALWSAGAGWLGPSPPPALLLNRRRPLPEESTPPAVNPDPAHIWPAIQSELRRAVPEHTYDLGLAALRPVAMDADTLLVEAPAGLRSRVAERFGRVLQSCAGAVLGPQARVEVV